MVSFMSSLRGQLVIKVFYDFIAKFTDIFVERMREAFHNFSTKEKLLHCKRFSQFFNKNIGVFQIFMFEILMKHYCIKSSAVQC